jgi:hypothetical protein
MNGLPFHPVSASNASTVTANPTVPTQYIITISSGACVNYDTISVYARQLSEL